MTTTELTGAEDVAWDLSDLYDGGDDPRTRAGRRADGAAAAAFRERYHGKVAELSAGDLREAIEERERIESTFTRAIYYAHLWFATDMADAPRGALVARLTETGAALDTQLLFFGLELAELDDERRTRSSRTRSSSAGRTGSAPCGSSARTCSPSPRRRSSPRSRCPACGVGAPLRRAARRDQGRPRRSRHQPRGGDGEALLGRPRRAAPGLRGGDRRARAGPPHADLRVQHVALDKSVDDRLRGYETWISSRNLRNDTSDEAVQALIDACVGRYDVVQRYYRLKARLLDVEQLAFYDRMAPIGDDPTKVSWGEAEDIVLGAYYDFATEAGDVARGSSPRAGSTPRCARTSAAAPSARRRCPACTRTCS